MTTWTSVPDSNLEPDQPGRSSDIIAIRDNITALAERASGAPWLNGIGAVEILTSGSSWTVPTGVHSVLAIIVGGGGGGGGAEDANGSTESLQAGGGGGGGEVRVAVFSVSPSQSKSMSIGSGGSGGASSGGDGGDGGDTTFNSVTAAGGSGGKGSDNGGGGGTVGAGSGGIFAKQGGLGGEGWKVDDVSGKGGNGGASLGPSIPGPVSSSAAPSGEQGRPATANNWGSGGSGAVAVGSGTDSETGGDGRQGCVILIY